MDNIYVRGNAGSEITFDFRRRCIKFERSGSLNRQLGIIDVELYFDDVTGFVLKKPSILTPGSVYVIVNNTLPFTNTGADFTDNCLTEICVQLSGYRQLEQAIMQFCSEVKNVPIYSKSMITAFNNNASVDIKRVKYTQRANPYETESKEYLRRCNVCGHTYCFTKADLERNLQARKMATMSTVGELAGAMSGNWGAAIVNSQNSKTELDKIIDYNKCPKCNSTNTSVLSEEEFKAIAKQSEQSNASSISGADELKKFKELLDSGVITQAEFEAKKKQILGF